MMPEFSKEEQIRIIHLYSEYDPGSDVNVLFSWLYTTLRIETNTF